MLYFYAGVNFFLEILMLVILSSKKMTTFFRVLLLHILLLVLIVENEKSTIAGLLKMCKYFPYSYLLESTILKK